MNPTIEEAKEDGPKAIQYVRYHVDKLKSLLDDPHPGLMTWAMFYGEHMQALCDFWNQPK